MCNPSGPQEMGVRDRRKSRSPRASWPDSHSSEEAWSRSEGGDQQQTAVLCSFSHCHTHTCRHACMHASKLTLWLVTLTTGCMCDSPSPVLQSLDQWVLSPAGSTSDIPSNEQLPQAVHRPRKDLISLSLGHVSHLYC
ncbi:hypothetical protein LEMLEM_LOCUS9623 [Lemmus lemmus]